MMRIEKGGHTMQAARDRWVGWDPEPFGALDATAVRDRWVDRGWIVRPRNGALIAWESESDMMADGSHDDRRVGIAWQQPADEAAR